LGMCFLAGGYYHKTLKFNGTAAQTSTGLLFIAVLGIMMPAALKAQLSQQQIDFEKYEANLNLTELGNATDEVAEEWEHQLPVETRLLILSRGTAIVMILIYGLFLFFQLKTHASFYENTETEPDEHDKKKKEEHLMKDEESEEEGKNMTWQMSLFFLAAITVLVAVCSEYLVDSIEGITKAWGISETFAGMVLLPIVGNAAEHLTAVTVSMKNKMDLAIGVAVGSSQQIAMMVTPLMVILGWIMSQPMSLYFEVFETAVLFMTVILVFALLNDGSSNWLEGAMLIGVYLILGIAFYVA